MPTLNPHRNSNIQKYIEKKSILLVNPFRIQIKTATFSVDILVQLLDDLELEFVAALEAQQQQDYRERAECSSGSSSISHNGSGVPVDWSPTPLGTVSSAVSSPKDLRKLEQKKRWKNWGWKYSPGGKTSSIEEEPPESPKQPSSKHSSPANSPKHKNQLAASPLRRQKSPSSPSGGSAGLRSSAGARLCQLIDDSQDDSGDELQALLINGRPASVHIVQMTSNGMSR